MKVCPVCGTEYADDAAFCSRDRSPLRPKTESGTPRGLVGQLIGERYQVERRLGEGGMGEVYLARHVLMGRPCALKVMSQSVSRDPDAVSRFNREATNASRITHPNVCTVYDFGLTAEGLVYLAMEFVDGGTLTDLLNSSGPMPLDRAASLVAQCAAGLAAAHELGIVHRDLKPDNIMVLTSRGRETVKLVDFGIAKAVEGDQSQRVTKTGFVVGTPEYMSPEQLSGDPVDARSDQYALALVFYRLITGRLPFDSGSMQETLVKRLTDPPRPLSAAHPGAKFPPALQSVMDKALARTPEERYQNVHEFSEAVQAVIAGDAAATRRIPAPGAPSRTTVPPTRPSPVVGPRRGARVLALSAVGVIVLGGVVAAVALRQRSAGATPPAPPAATGDTGTIARTAGLPASDSGPAVGPTKGAVAPPPAPTTTPAPAPAPPAPQPVPLSAPVSSSVALNPDSVAADTAAVPAPDQLDAPATRLRAMRIATRILLGPRTPPRKRAEAAAFLGHDAVQREDWEAALRYFQRANELHPSPGYESIVNRIRARLQARDTIPL